MAASKIGKTNAKSEIQVDEFLSYMIFVRVGSEKMVKLLIQNKANVNAIDLYGHTALDATSDATIGKYIVKLIKQKIYAKVLKFCSL